MTKVYIAKNIVDATAAGGRTLINKSCYVTSVVVNPVAGAQTLIIQDRGQTTPAIPVKILIGPVTFVPANLGIPTVLELFNDRVLMIGGLVAITTGIGPVNVWACASMTDEE